MILHENELIERLETLASLVMSCTTEVPALKFAARCLEEIEEHKTRIDRDHDAMMDDSMDGDDASALASAGFGTDEDYGGSNEH